MTNHRDHQTISAIDQALSLIENIICGDGQSHRMRMEAAKLLRDALAHLEESEER